MQPTDMPERQPALNVPAPVTWLVAGLVLAHILRAALPDAESEKIILEYALIPARYSGDFQSAYGVFSGTILDQIVPFFSYMALHGDFTHLGINMLWLLVFGPVVARRFGAAKFFLFFIICGLAGAFMHLATNWGSLSPVVGASAAISGLMGAAVRMLDFRAPFYPAPANDKALEPLWGRQPLSFTAVWLGLNAFIGITGMGASPGGEIRLIAWQAHMGGYFAGYLLAGPVDRLFGALRRA